MMLVAVDARAVRHFQAYFFKKRNWKSSQLLWKTSTCFTLQAAVAQLLYSYSFDTVVNFSNACPTGRLLSAQVGMCVNG